MVKVEGNVRAVDADRPDQIDTDVHATKQNTDDVTQIIEDVVEELADQLNDPEMLKALLNSNMSLEQLLAFLQSLNLGALKIDTTALTDLISRIESKLANKSGSSTDETLMFRQDLAGAMKPGQPGITEGSKLAHTPSNLAETLRSQDAQTKLLDAGLKVSVQGQFVTLQGFGGQVSTDQLGMFAVRGDPAFIDSSRQVATGAGFTELGQQGQQDQQQDEQNNPDQQEHSEADVIFQIEDD